MAGWNPNQGFSMPMFNPWVPEKIRPWIYLLFAFFFQLSSGVYFGSLQQRVGVTGLMREDIQMVAMFGVVGVNMPFPFLFRYKLRFTNQQLLINAALVIAACNLLSLWLIDTDFGEWRLPLLCAISYIAGYFKLCGTFECFSNIRLWLSPKQDFGVFLPSLYIIILAAMPASNWICQQLTIAFDSWQMMHWLMVGLMLIIVLEIYTCTHAWRMMHHQVPLISLDWLGCLLWSSCMLQVIWLFTYGEYYNWWDSATWRTVLCFLPLTIAISIGRMTHIRHPYIAPYVSEHWRLLPILGMFFVAELMNATPHALQNTLTGGVLHWGFTTNSQFSLLEILGYGCGSAFTILWGKETPKWGRIPRLGFKYTRLLNVGIACLLLYQVMMYFIVSPVLNVERLYLPTFLRTFGYAIFFATMTLYLKDLIEFPTFFHALTVSGFIRNGVAESMCSGIYSYGLRRQIADTLNRGLHSDYQSILMVAVKEMYGIMSIVGVFVLLLMLLYDVQPVRSTMRKMPTLKALGKLIVNLKPMAS
jgi:hypothetical protein